MVKQKMLMVTVENTVTVGNNNAIEAVVEHQIMVYESKEGGIGIDVDFTDINKVKFLGIEIESGYDAYNKFKAQMTEFGIDVDTLIDEACVGIITTGEVEKCKNMFKKIV